VTDLRTATGRAATDLRPEADGAWTRATPV